MSSSRILSLKGILSLFSLGIKPKLAVLQVWKGFFCLFFLESYLADHELLENIERHVIVLQELGPKFEQGEGRRI